MAIKQTTPQNIVNAYLDQEIQRREQALLYNLAYVGEMCINEARSTTKAANNYKDQTGNLRSSVGYVLVHNGRIVQSSSFKSVLNGQQGATEGSGYAKQLAKKYRQGIVLILVAGMNYAVHVQNKGYDVLTSAEQMAERLVPRIMKQLGITK